MSGRFRGNKKGVLFTLLIVVLFLLMVTELVSYVTINMTYDKLTTGENIAFGSSTVQSTLNAGMAAFLGHSLSSAVAALTTYAETPTIRGGNFFNNTAYALESLMMNGTVYGTNMMSYNAISSNDTIDGYVAALRSQVLAQVGNMSLTNATLTVYQGSPYYLNATYTAFVVINTTQGTFEYPLIANASMPLNGTTDLYSAEAADPHTIRFQPQLPTAVRLGNTFATSGNTVSTAFAYGTVVNLTNPTCATIPSKFKTTNYILVARSATSIAQNICGMGGLITYAANTSLPNAPYLVYASSSNVIGTYIKNGTTVLLAGKGLETLDVSALQNAINNGYYFASTYTPSYLDWAQGNNNARSADGMFSFDILNRKVGALKHSAFSAVTITDSSINTAAGGYNTVAFWMRWYGATNAVMPFGMTSYDLYLISSSCFGFNTGNSDDYGVSISPYVNKWVFVVAEFYNGAYTGNNHIYLNGINQTFSQCAGTAHSGTAATSLLIGGWPNNVNYRFDGNLANVQIYGNALSQAQVMELYKRGLGGIPLSSSSLVGWWPLNGDSNDYSGIGSSSVPTNMSYAGISNYTGDPIYGGSTMYSGINVTEGVLNCGTSSECSSAYLTHLYLRNITLSSSAGANLNESAALNLANAITPN